MIATVTGGLSATANFNVKVIDCSLATISKLGTAVDQTYRISYSELRYSLPGFQTSDSDCPLSYSMLQDGGAVVSPFTYASVLKKLKVYGFNNAKAGTINFIYRATNPYGTQLDYTFTVTVNKNCDVVRLHTGNWTKFNEIYKITESALTITKAIPTYNDSGCTYY